MVIPLISGGLNLAIIATTNQCALLMAWIMSTATFQPAPVTPEIVLVVAAALLAGLVLCTVIGLVTGFLVASMGVHPILVTLGTKSVIDGVSIWLTRGTVVSGLPNSFQWLGNGVLLGVPVPFLRPDPGGGRGRADPHPHLVRRLGLHAGLEPRGDALFGHRHPPRADRHLYVLERALLRRRLPDAGALQLGQRRLRPVLPADHDPGGRPRRGRPVRRLRPDLRRDAGADRAAGDLLGLQPPGPQPAPDPGDLGADPDRRHGHQVSVGALARRTLGQGTSHRRINGRKQ